ncbi:uncharacterized protein LOC108157180 [Drosophila miranda]|uniref:uncharacterized protein LOC108157180 n=1 Tax=Drosophila miranda TaxID=7229 RepID=UPI0007E8743A|nr:uncharacterized protein LOC108157180 [Drosophila miranda]
MEKTNESNYCTCGDVFITRWAPFNFLREFRHACIDYDWTPQELVNNALETWQTLTPLEKSRFEQDQYLPYFIAETVKHLLEAQEQNESKENAKEPR